MSLLDFFVFQIHEHTEDLQHTKLLKSKLGLCMTQVLSQNVISISLQQTCLPIWLIIFLN